jgi:hypothetical protein
MNSNNNLTNESNDSIQYESKQQLRYSEENQLSSEIDDARMLEGGINNSMYCPLSNENFSDPRFEEFDKQALTEALRIENDYSDSSDSNDSNVMIEISSNGSDDDRTEPFESKENSSSDDENINNENNNGENGGGCDGMSIDQFIENIQNLSSEEKTRKILKAPNEKQEIQPITFQMYQLTNTNNLNIRIDIDSIMWSGQDLPIEQDMKFYPIPNRNATLTNNNYLTYQIYHCDYSQPIYLYQIPNFEIGTTGPNSIFRILIFFPNLMRQHETNGRWINFVTSSNYQLFYDYVARPSLIQVLGESADIHLPINYETCYKLNQNHWNQIHFPGYLIPFTVVPAWIYKMKVMIESNSLLKKYFGNFFFHIYAKDLKLSLFQNLNHQNTNHIIQLFQKHYGNVFNTETILQQIIYDIGVEISEIDEYQYKTLLLDKNHFLKYFDHSPWCNVKCYPWCGTNDIQGARCQMLTKAIKNTHILHLQIYFSEKEILYSKTLQKNHSLKNFNHKDFIDSNEKFSIAMNSIKNALENSRYKNYSIRFEFRTSYQGMNHLENPSLLNKFMNNIVKNNLIYSIPTNSIINFKMTKLNCYEFVSNRMKELSVSEKYQKERTQLAMIITLFIKTLYESVDIKKERMNPRARSKSVNIVLSKFKAKNRGKSICGKK